MAIKHSLKILIKNNVSLLGEVAAGHFVLDPLVGADQYAGLVR